MATAGYIHTERRVIQRKFLPNKVTSTYQVIGPGRTVLSEHDSMDEANVELKRLSDDLSKDTELHVIPFSESAQSYLWALSAETGHSVRYILEILLSDAMCHSADGKSWRRRSSPVKREVWESEFCKNEKGINK